MPERNFMDMLQRQWNRGNFVCVGLDSEYKRIPQTVISRSRGTAIVAFNRRIIDATADLVCAYKPNIAFYEALGPDGWYALHETISYIRRMSSVPIILDAKRGDIGNTNDGYAKMAFDYLNADAITVHSYLGAEALQPFLARTEKGIIVLCRTSNPGAGEFQDLSVDSEPLYRFVARRVANEWNKNKNCALVVGATYPHELQEVRGLVRDLPILIPGIGAQGGDIEATVKAGQDSRGEGMIINSSRGIIFASNGPDFAKAARRETERLRDLINQYRHGGAA